MRRMKTNFICVLLFLSFSLQSQVYNNPGGSGIACAGTFFDTGSAGGNYGLDENITTTFCSDGANISVNFTSFDTEEFFDFLKIYDGEDASAEALHPDYGFTGTNGPGLVTSTGSCLTFLFTSDDSVVSTGWAATIACETIPCEETAVPENVSHSIEAASRCKISWTAVPGAIKYDVNYRERGTLSWARVTALSNEKMLRNLEDNTIYQYIIRASCDGTWTFDNATEQRQFNTANILSPAARKTGFDSDVLTVFPNPARASIRVNYSTETASNNNLYITDMTGRLVFEKELVGMEGNQSEEIDIASLGEGFYFLVIQSGQNRMVKKFAKMK